MYPPKVVMEIKHSSDDEDFKWEIFLNGIRDKCSFILSSPKQHKHETPITVSSPSIPGTVELWCIVLLSVWCKSVWC